MGFSHLARCPVCGTSITLAEKQIVPARAERRVRIKAGNAVRDPRVRSWMVQAEVWEDRPHLLGRDRVASHSRRFDRQGMCTSNPASAGLKG